MLDVASRPWIPGAWYTLVQLQVGRWMLRICCSPEALLRFDPHFQFWGPVLGLKCSVFSHHLMGGCQNPLWVPGHSGSLHDLGHTKTFLTVLIVWTCISSVQLLSRVQLFATSWTAAHQASLSITNSWSSPKSMPIELVMPSNHLILCRPLLLLPSVFPSIRFFSNQPALRIRWPKYWSFSFNISLPVNTQDWSPLGWTGWISCSPRDS